MYVCVILFNTLCKVISKLHTMFLYFTLIPSVSEPQDMLGT